MDARLQEMLDHYEITKTLNDYCHACDRCDVEGVANVYAEDSWDDHGRLRCPGPEFAEAITRDVLTTTKGLQHMLGQTLIKVSGDHAGAETYFIAFARESDADGIDRCKQLGGRFVDRLVREGGRWRIKHRTVVRDWSLSLKIEEEWESTASLKPGKRSNEDPSFAVLGRVHGGTPVL